MWCEEEVQLHAFAWGYLVAPASFVEKDVPSTLNSLGTLADKSVNQKYEDLILDSEFYSNGLHVYSCVGTTLSRLL